MRGRLRSSGSTNHGRAPAARRRRATTPPAHPIRVPKAWRYGARMPGRVLIGTSSWADPGFVEEWYPPGMAAKDRLAWYAARFETVEVNSSFYAIPELGTVVRWCEVTPEDFVFDYKLHKA